MKSTSGRELQPLEHDLVATFGVSRGSVAVPAALFEEGREDELRVFLAERLPHRCTSLTRRVTRDGVTIHWRKVGVTVRRADHVETRIDRRALR
jgi:hypothetical protein